uniref:PH domain-containing protein n=1 Tax=Nothobranchius furzeri TaxID=105023 RepID=A0A8C6LVS6_NOTFU
MWVRGASATTGWDYFPRQWKEKYLVLTVEGSLLVCRDAESPPDQVVALQTSCELIVEGREILDLPRLPPGGRRDCCFALILPQNKFLLLLSDSPEDCFCRVCVLEQRNH